jgi:alcohol dehydrogenase class IV
MGLHHKLCHTLGGTFDLPHAETHAVLLAYAMAYNQTAVPDAAAVIARALGVEDAAAGLFSLMQEVAPARSLQALGMPEGGIDRAADLVVANPYWNPRSIERGGIRDLIARAWKGVPPIS